MKRILTIVAALLLGACTDRPGPAPEQIRAQITQALQAGSDGRLFAVAGVRTLDDIPRDAETYVVEVEYELRFKVGPEEALSELQKESGSIFAAGAEAAELHARYGDFQRGDSVQRKARALFLRTDEGWRLEALTPVETGADG